MELLSRTHPGFIAKLHGRDFVIQIDTAQGSQRYFQVQRNRVTSRNTLHARPDLGLHFRSDAVAYRLLVNGNASTFMDAMQKQDVKVSGDYALLMWFMGIGKFLQPRLRGGDGTASTAG